MNLVLDIGNTRSKIGIFQGDELLENRDANIDLLQEMVNVLDSFPKVNQGIISSVGLLPNSLESFLKEKISVINLSFKTPLPITIQYNSPQTLGSDRIALAVGGWYHANKRNVLIIDMGTCITYDFVNELGEYTGGAISPGLMMRYKSLNLMTASLPSLQPSEKNIDLIGNTTQDSIHSGVHYGILNELEGFIMRYQNQFPGLSVLITGGDKIYFEEQLKNVIFADSNLVLFGLNKILRFNELH